MRPRSWPARVASFSPELAPAPSVGLRVPMHKTAQQCLTFHPLVPHRKHHCFVCQYPPCTWHNAIHPEFWIHQAVSRSRRASCPFDLPFAKEPGPCMTLLPLSRMNLSHGMELVATTSIISEMRISEKHEITQCLPWSVRRKTGKMSFVDFCFSASTPFSFFG